MTEYSGFYYSNRTAILQNRYFVAELCRNHQEKVINIIYDAIGNGMCLYDSAYRHSNKKAFRYRTKEFKVSVQTKQAQFMKGIHIKAKGSFTAVVYGDNSAIAVIEHNETDNLNPMRIVFQNVSNARYSTYSILFIGYEGTQIHDWEVYY